MKLILTSSPCLECKGEINPSNGFVEELRRSVNPCAKGVFITATPDDAGMSEWAAFSMKENMELAGLSFSNYEVIERRNAKNAERIVNESNFIILGGGHVPTQNRFFHEIGLRAILQNYEGVVMGISAGSMNCADPVYAQPEEEGEAIDPSYRHFLHGLRLTNIQILPHFQKVRNNLLDGMRLIEDITFKHSRGHQFYALPDGSYIVSDGKTQELRGKAYVISNSTMKQICDDGMRITLF